MTKVGRPSFRCMVILAALALASFAPAVCRADSMKFTFNNGTEYPISLKFYSRDRNHHWPSQTRAYVLSAGSKSNAIKIECNAEERICYGGWAERKSSWGAGQSGMLPCESCCYVCKDGSRLKGVTFTQFVSR